MPDYSKLDLTNVKFDGDPFNVREGVTPEEPPEPTFDPDNLNDSTNSITDSDEIITKENDEWVKKPILKIWDYIRSKIGLKSNGNGEKYLNEKGEWVLAADTRSYVGMVIHSTTFDTEAKVKSFYGGTTWIQHSGYFLRGASSDVTANSAVKDGGQDTVTPSGTNSDGAVKSHTLTVNEMPSHRHTEIIGNEYPLTDSNGTGPWSNSGIQPKGGYQWLNHNSCMVASAGGGQGHTHGFTQPTFTGTAHTNLPSYKNVYIWERTA